MKIAFLGTGYINRAHAAAAAKIPGVQLAAAINPNVEHAQAFAAQFGIPRPVGRLEDLLDEGGLDALVVSPPNAFHAPATIAALRAGVNVLVEKPMAMNAREAEEMVAAAKESGAVLMVAHCWRFDQEVNWLKSQADAGKLGRIVRTKGYGVHVNWGPDGWFRKKELAGGGALADMGIHALDTARYLLGDPNPVSVYARVGTYYIDADVDDTGVIVVNWDNGATSYIESGWWQPHSDGPEAATQLYGITGFGSVFPTRLLLPDRGRGTVQAVDPGYAFPRAEQCPQEMYDRQMAHFVDCARNHREPLASGEIGWSNMKVIDAAYLSSQIGKVIEL